MSNPKDELDMLFKKLALIYRLDLRAKNVGLECSNHTKICQCEQLEQLWACFYMLTF